MNDLQRLLDAARAYRKARYLPDRQWGLREMRALGKVEESLRQAAVAIGDVEIVEATALTDGDDIVIWEGLPREIGTSVLIVRQVKEKKDE